MRECLIDFSKQETYEAGAVLVSFLAYPPEKDSHAREHLQKSLCAAFLKEQFAANPKAAATPQQIKPIYAFRDPKQIQKDWRTLGRRIQDRMIAAQMAIAFLKEAHSPSFFTLPRSLARLSVNQMSEFMLSNAEYSDPENVESRIWRPSLPIIHLAAAVAVDIDISEKRGMPRTSIGDLLNNRETLEWIVHEAEYFEGLIAKSRHLTFDPAILVKFRLTQTGSFKKTATS